MVAYPISWFESAATALAFMVLTLFATAAFYIWAHSRGPSGLERHLAAMAQAVRFSADGFCSPWFDDAALERWYGRGEIAAVKSRIKEKAADVARQNAQERRQVLGQVRDLGVRGVSDAGPLAFLPAPGHDTGDAAWNAIRLDEVSSWLEGKAPLFAAARQPDVVRLGEALDRQQEREADRRRLLQAELGSLDSALSFAWLKVEGAGWVWEVIAWSIFGVIANTIVGLIQAAGAHRYKADEFVLVFPKLALAPLLALVAVALWSSGFSTASVTFVNLPLFLVLAFSLGLATEQLYTALRQAAQWLVARFTALDEDKFKAAEQGLAYRFVTPPPPAAPTPPANLRQLGELLRATGQAAVERSLVAQLSRSS